MLPVGAVVVLGVPRRVVPVVPVGVGLVIGTVGPGIGNCKQNYESLTIECINESD